MKKHLFCVLLILSALLGCSEGMKIVETEYIIRVSGTEKLAFSGHYTFPGTAGIPKATQVKGAVPMEFKGKGIAVNCYFRKTQPDGLLRVEIIKADKPVATNETSSPYGIITLNKVPDKESFLNQILGKILG